MKQVLMREGQMSVEEVDMPVVSPSTILVRNEYSLISTGTELSIIHGASKSVAQTVMSDRKKFQAGMAHLREKGVRATIDVVRRKGKSWSAMGYSTAGIVEAVGRDIKDISVGDRVACAGAEIANHAEFVTVPRNLVTRLPDNVSSKDGASVTVGSIALQGVRQADPRIGETVAVIGLGLLGQITVQLLKASGCKVIAIDLNFERANLAKNFGADTVCVPGKEDVISKIRALQSDHGVDATIITASTQSSEPVQQALEITRKRGTIVIVGAVGMNIQHSPFYEKEILLKISCSYGPGRYDSSYELEGKDYPYPFVRWTENRNMQAYVDLLSRGAIHFSQLVSGEYDVSNAPEAYTRLADTDEGSFALLLRYPRVANPEKVASREPVYMKSGKKRGVLNVGFIGAGSFASSVHLPNILKLQNEYTCRAIADRDAVQLKNLTERFHPAYTTTDYKTILQDPSIDFVIISTRHDMHASISSEALKAGKSVFVEKPMALSVEELKKLEDDIRETSLPFMVGFNRRFSPHAQRIKQEIQNRANPLVVYYRMNAGYFPLDHWVHGSEGGGRIVGEACHIYDLFAFLTDADPVLITASSIRSRTDNILAGDNFTSSITYNDGSVCTLVYTSLGSSILPKEYGELYCDGRTYVIDDYNKLIVLSERRKEYKEKIQQKGHLEELASFAKTLKGEQEGLPIDLKTLISVTETSFKVRDLVQGDTKIRSGVDE